MVSSILYVHNQNDTHMSWKDKVKSKIKDWKSRFVHSKYYEPIKTVGRVLGMATTVATYYASVWAVAYFTIVLVLALGGSPIVAVILAIWFAVVWAFSVVGFMTSMLFRFLKV